MCAFLQRLTSAAIFLGWLLPGVSAVGVGVHLESAHLEAHAPEHEAALADLLKAAAHGHHHDLETDLDHDHGVRLAGDAPISRPDRDVIATLTGVSFADTKFVQASALDQALRRGPPTPLFTAHCVLLI